MKTFRTILCLLIAVLCLSLAGCGRSASTSSAEASASAAVSTSETAGGAETVTQTEYGNDDGETAAEETEPATVNRAEYDDDGNVVSTTHVPVPETVTGAEYSTEE